MWSSSWRDLWLRSGLNLPRTYSLLPPAGSFKYPHLAPSEGHVARPIRYCCIHSSSDGPMNGDKRLRYADVGINIGDPVFKGVYHGKRQHENDLDDIIQRAVEVGCSKLMVTGSDLKESAHAVELAKQYPGICYATIGVHPCSTKSFESPHGSATNDVLTKLKELAVNAKDEGYGVAFGEIGLDYDRLFLSPKETQLKYFEQQLNVAVEIGLPLFLHMRAACDDFVRLLQPRLDRLPKRGLVHSFTGSMQEMQQIADLGFDIGINGCSMKTEENIEVVRAVPLERIQIETDGPWCEIRPSHASAKFLAGSVALPKSVRKEKWQKGLMVKGRNEPVTIVHVAHVVSKIKDISVEELCETAWANSIKMFSLGEKPS